MSQSERKPEPKLKTLRCPICRKIVTAKDPEFPFCSERCRIIDLGKWASGAYRISSPVLDPDALPEAFPEASKDVSKALEEIEKRQRRASGRRPEEDK